MFKVSGRFVSHTDPDQFKYIPELERRVKLNNSLMTAVKEALDLKFRIEVIIPSVFEL